MKIDITFKITPKIAADAQGNEKKALVGHLGTHFDIMNKDFPLEYTERAGIVFDVSSVVNRDIDVQDIDFSKIAENMFVAFSRPGSDLLSRVLRQSTIGAGVFHGRVRKGNGCGHPAITTRSAKRN